MDKKLEREYLAMINKFRESPNKKNISDWWKEHEVDSLEAYIWLQFIREKNPLPESILEPKANEIIKIKLKGIEYFVPMKDICHMGDGNREPWLIEALSDVKEGDLFVDIGANLGLFAIPVGKITKVIAFEPDAVNYDLLIKNTTLNGVQENVTVLKNIVSDIDGKMKLYSSKFSQIATIVDPSRVDWEPEIVSEVDSVTIDKFMEDDKIEKIDWLKIDVEGGEYQILKGAKNSLTNKKIENILVEIHASLPEGITYNDVYDLLRENYEIKDLWIHPEFEPYRYIHAKIKH